MKTKDYRGITLISLIVTIIVLLILAGISISVLTGDNGTITQSISAVEKADIANTRESIEFTLKYDEKGQYKVQDVLEAVEEVTESSINVKEGTVLSTKGNTVDISDLLNRTTDIILGISDDDYGYVIGEISSGAGTGIMYVKVTGADVEDNYDTDSYPTTLCTFQEDGETHNYIFAGWYEVDDGESSFTSIPTSSSEYVYAKFVDIDVLSIICVFTPSSITGSYNAWRFFSGITDLSLDECYFIVDGGEYITGTGYPSYNIGDGAFWFYPSDFSHYCKWIITTVFLDSSNMVGTSCTVRAGWKTYDGSKVFGPTYTFDASDCTSQTVLSGTVSY